MSEDATIRMIEMASSTPGPPAPPIPPEGGGGDGVAWTPKLVVFSLFLFVLAGIAEVGGGWLVWFGRRELNGDGRAIAAGSLILIIYGFIPTFQPSSVFARVYAVYGGFFIVLSYLWGWVVDKTAPDAGDWIGMAISLVGVLICWFYPRSA